MARHLDFRNHGYLPLCGILDDFASLRLGVMTFIRNSVIAYHRIERSYEGLLALRTHFYELRVLLNLDSPALVLGKMPVESVDFMNGQYVQIVLNVFYTEEMTTHVEVNAAIGECRSVFDVHSVNLVRILLGQLKNCHKTIPNSVSATSANEDLSFHRLAVEGICLFCQCIVRSQDKSGIAFLRSALPNAGAIFGIKFVERLDKVLKLR